MIQNIVGAVLLTAAVGAFGEFILRRNRRSLVLREHLAAHGTAVTGTVRAIDKVTTNRYGGHKLRATIDYQVDGGSHTHVVAWTPEHAPRLGPGDSIDLLMDPAQPSSVCVADAPAPAVGGAAPYWLLAVGLGIALFVLLQVS
jgi:hypothetical protein